MQKASVIFQFSGSEIDPDYITRSLSIAPTRHGLRGFTRWHGKRGKYPTNYWGYETQRSSKSLDDQLNDLLDVIEPHAEGLELLRSEGYVPKFYCGVFYTTGDQRIRISPKTLSRISMLQPVLEIHCYDTTETKEMDPD